MHFWVPLQIRNLLAAGISFSDINQHCPEHVVLAGRSFIYLQRNSRLGTARTSEQVRPLNSAAK